MNSDNQQPAVSVLQNPTPPWAHYTISVALPPSGVDAAGRGKKATSSLGPVKDLIAKAKRLDSALRMAGRVHVLYVRAPLGVLATTKDWPKACSILRKAVGEFRNLRWVFRVWAPGQAGGVNPQDWGLGEESGVCVGLRIENWDDQSIRNIAALRAGHGGLKMLSLAPSLPPPDPALGLGAMLSGFGWLVCDIGAMPDESAGAPALELARWLRTVCKDQGIAFFLHRQGQGVELDGLTWREHPFGEAVDLSSAPLKKVEQILGPACLGSMAPALSPPGATVPVVEPAASSAAAASAPVRPAAAPPPVAGPGPAGSATPAHAGPGPAITKPGKPKRGKRPAVEAAQLDLPFGGGGIAGDDAADGTSDGGVVPSGLEGCDLPQGASAEESPAGGGVPAAAVPAKPRGRGRGRKAFDDARAEGERGGGPGGEVPGPGADGGAGAGAGSMSREEALDSAAECVDTAGANGQPVPAESVKFEVVAKGGPPKLRRVAGGKKPDGLTEEQCRDFERLHRIVKNFAKCFIGAAAAMREIRNRRLWPAGGFANWADYSDTVLGITKRYANSIIASLEAVEFMLEVGRKLPTSPPMMMPSSASQVAPMLRLKDPDERREAWAKAVESAGGEQPPIKVVKQAVAEILARQSAKAGSAAATPPRKSRAERLADVVRRLKELAEQRGDEELAALALELEDLI